MVILAATDAKNVPDRVVDVAADIANAYDDELRVLHVAEPGDDDTLPLDSGAFTYDASSGEERNLVDQAKEIALKVANRTLGNDASVVPIGRSGDVEEAIVEEAAAADARFIVIGGRKRSPAGKAIFGSATQSVLLSADRPVVTVLAEPT